MAGRNTLRELKEIIADETGHPVASIQVFQFERLLFPDFFQISDFNLEFNDVLDVFFDGQGGDDQRGGGTRTGGGGGRGPTRRSRSDIGAFAALSSYKPRTGGGGAGPSGTAKHVNNLYQQMDSEQGEKFLEGYIELWNAYKFASWVVNGAFAYLNRHWIQMELDQGNKEVCEVYDMAINTWKAGIFEKLLDKIKHSAALALIAEENGSAEDKMRIRALIKAVSESFFEYGIKFILQLTYGGEADQCDSGTGTPTMGLENYLKCRKLLMHRLLDETNKRLPGDFSYLNRHWIRREMEKGKDNKEICKVYDMATNAWKTEMFDILPDKIQHCIVAALIAEKNAAIALNAMENGCAEDTWQIGKLIKAVSDLFFGIGIEAIVELMNQQPEEADQCDPGEGSSTAKQENYQKYYQLFVRQLLGETNKRLRGAPPKAVSRMPQT